MSNLTTIQTNLIKVMSENPEKWGDSDWNIAIDLDDNSVSIDHNTTCYNECCSNQDVATVSLYGFDVDGWFEYDEENDTHTTPIDLENWSGSEMFSESTINEWIEENDD